MTEDRHMRNRIGTGRPRAALAAAATAILTVAALASVGSAQTTPGTTLHLVSHAQRHVGFSPKAEPRQGSMIGFGDKITGDDHGTSRGVCTLIGDKMLCTIQVQLSRGSLSVQALLPEHDNHTPVAIVGGTGAYNGARGTAVVTDTSPTSSSITVRLLA